MITRERIIGQGLRLRLPPRRMPVLEGAELAVAWRPSGPVSGDYFDVISFDESRAALCVGDVMGKGMSAALVMSNLQALVRGLASAEEPPQRFCEQINRAVCGNLPEGGYITFFYGLFEIASRRLVYANAGHNPPLLARRDGRTAELSEGGVVLGLFPESLLETCFSVAGAWRPRCGIYPCRRPKPRQFSDWRFHCS